MENRYDTKIIRENVLSMIVPITFENILQMAAGVVSMAFVGRINELAIGAVGLSNILFRIAWALFKGLGVGSSAFVARNLGAQKNHKISMVIKQGSIIAIGFSLIMQQIIFWNAETLLRIFDSSPELLSTATVYLKIISWSLPLAAIIQFVAGVLQGMGNAKSPMLVVSILNIVNIIFSFLLIFGNLGFSPLGLKGAGYAYVIAHIVSAIVGVYFLIKMNREIMAEVDHAQESNEFRREEFVSLLKYGAPTSFELAFIQVASIFVTRAILKYGETAYAAYQLGLQAESVSYMPAMGLAIAATAFVGRSLGANDKKLGKMYLNELLKFSIIITLFAGGALVLFPNYIMRALTDDLEIVSIGSTYLIVMGFAQMPQNLSGLFNGVLRGAGYPNAPLIHTGTGIWLIRIPLILIVSNYFDANILWIWLCMATDLVFRFIFSYGSFKRKDVFNED